jgi:hypothetical protein
MSQTYGRQHAPSGATPHARTGPNVWAVGWTTFAGTLMSVLGGWWLMTGFIALIDDEFYVATGEYLFQFDLTTWGWIHLGTGLVLLAAGIGLFSGAVWARVVGVFVAAITMLLAFAWVPYYPVWGLLFIGSSIAVIWSLTAHGRDITEA